MAERCVRNAEVRGSTPLISTIYFRPLAQAGGFAFYKRNNIADKRQKKAGFLVKVGLRLRMLRLADRGLDRQSVGAN